MTTPPKIDRQREHQANERTFLAWIRTSIAMISFGLAIARFGLFLHELQYSVDAAPSSRSALSPAVSSQTLGIGLVTVGIIMILFAVWQYNRVFWQIETADYRPSRIIVWLTAGLVLVLGLLSLPLILWRQTPQPPAQPQPQRNYPGKPRSDRRLDLFSTRLAHLVHPQSSSRKR